MSVGAGAAVHDLTAPVAGAPAVKAKRRAGVRDADPAAGVRGAVGAAKGAIGAVAAVERAAAAIV